MSEEAPKPPETFRSHLPALAGSVTGTLIAAIIGSHVFGPSGTKYALLGGSCLSGSASWWTERAIRRSHDLAKAKLRAAKAKGRPLNPQETQLIEVVHKVSGRKGGVHYRTIVLLVLAAFLIAFLTVAALDKLGAKGVSDEFPAPAVTRTTFVPVPAVSPSRIVTQTTEATPSPPIADTQTIPASASPSPSTAPAQTIPATTPSSSPSPVPDLTPPSSTPAATSGVLP